MDDAVLEDPYPAYRELLAGGPVHHNARLGVWVLSHYEDVRAAGRASDQLSSAEGVIRLRHRLPMMLTIGTAPTTPACAASSPASSPATRWRRCARASRSYASEAVDSMLAAPRRDAVATLAQPLPVAMIAELLGVPDVDLPRFRRWSDDIVEGFNTDPSFAAMRRTRSVVAAVAALRAYVERQLEPAPRAGR